MLLFHACSHRTSTPFQRFEYREIHMGVQVRLVLYAPDEETARRAARAAYARIGGLDETMSDWRADSELMRLCAQAGGAPVRVSEDLFRVLRRAQELAEKSDGAFDVTLGPMIQLWRQARKSGRLPTAEEIEKTRARCGWRKLRLNPRSRTVQLAVEGMRLNLGGIGKGYAGDCALAELRKQGVPRALFEAGGDIVLGDPPPAVAALEEMRGPPGWLIRLFDTNDMLLLSNCAVSTSGDAEQFVEVDGVRYSHIVDPQTGLGLTRRNVVTVIARNGLIADSLSTALSVLGEERGRILLRDHPRVRAIFRAATSAP